MSPHEAGSTGAALALMAVKTLLLFVGGLITYFAFKAYRRTRQPALGYLAAGFGIVTLGFVLAGLLYEILAVDLVVGVLLESALALVGFAVIAYSLYAR